MFLLIFFAAMYFFMIRPQQKQKKQRQELLNNLEKGDKVITIGGIHGVIVALTDDDLMLEVAPDVKIKMQRSSVGTVNVPEEKEAVEILDDVEEEAVEVEADAVDDAAVEE